MCEHTLYDVLKLNRQRHVYLLRHRCKYLDRRVVASSENHISGISTSECSVQWLMDNNTGGTEERVFHGSFWLTLKPEQRITIIRDGIPIFAIGRNSTRLLSSTKNNFSHVAITAFDKCQLVMSEHTNVAIVRKPKIVKCLDLFFFVQLKSSY